VRRADRLFQLMLLLQEGKVRTAHYLAEKLEVSDRTIYRDIGDLIGSGIPIDGEAGVGYLLRDEYRLPPLMFTSEELQALALGAQMVRVWADQKMASTTATAIRKIESILPDKLKQEIELQAIQVPSWGVGQQLKDNLELARLATDENCKLSIHYQSLQGEQTSRVIWPFILYFWGNKWTLGAWCELRQAFRSFRIDLMTGIEKTGELYDPTIGRDLQAYMDYQAGRNR
jgi:predicted DNA-binding transcriptional regulator YafY